MIYEVERRTFGHFDLFGAELSCSGYIHDDYYRISPVQVRLRKIAMDFPQKQLSYAFATKKRRSNAFVEREICIDEQDYLKFRRTLSGKYGSPVITVSGYRLQYKSNGLVICVDEVDSLGPWTEIEKIVLNEQEIFNALNEILEMFAAYGRKGTSVIDKTYLEMRISEPEPINA